jgi:hypothetical protein
MTKMSMMSTMSKMFKMNEKNNYNVRGHSSVIHTQKTKKKQFGGRSKEFDALVVEAKVICDLDKHCGVIEMVDGTTVSRKKFFSSVKHRL